MTISPVDRHIFLLVGLALVLCSAARAESIPEHGKLLGTHPKGAATVEFSPDDKLLVSSGGDLVIRFWDLATHKEVRQLKGHVSFVLGVTFSPDGKQFASAGHEQTIYLWNLDTGEVLRKLDGHPKGVRRVVFSPDGKRLASCGWDGMARIWDPATGRELVKIPDLTRTTWSVAFSPDGKTLAVSGSGGLFGLWDANTGQEIRRFPNLPCDFFDVAFSPDGKLLATGGEKGLVTLWEAATGKRIRDFAGHEQSVSNVALAPDGRTLISASYDKTVRLWELASGKEIRRFSAHSDWAWGVAMSSNGQQIATASKDESVRLWEPHALIAASLPPAGKLSAEQQEALWKDLAADDVVLAYRAVWTLVGVGEQAVALLAEHLRPVPVSPEIEKAARWIEELDDDQFQVREKASAELEKMGRPAVYLLRKALEAQPSPEVRRRVEELLQKLDSPDLAPDQLQLVRAFHVLTLIGNPQARQLLEKLARGAVEGDVTQEAKSALAYLNRRPREKP